MALDRSPAGVYESVPPETGLHEAAIMMPVRATMVVTGRTVARFRRTAVGTFDDVTLGARVRCATLALERVVGTCSIHTGGNAFPDLRTRPTSRVEFARRTNLYITNNYEKWLTLESCFMKLETNPLNRCKTLLAAHERFIQDTKPEVKIKNKTAANLRLCQPPPHLTDID